MGVECHCAFVPPLLWVAKVPRKAALSAGLEADFSSLLQKLEQEHSVRVEELEAQIKAAEYQVLNSYFLCMPTSCVVGYAIVNYTFDVTCV